MNIINSAFSGIMNLFAFIIMIGIGFTALTFGTCNTVAKNQELRSKTFQQEQQLSQLTKEIDSLKSILISFKGVHEQNLETIKRVETQRDAYAEELKIMQRTEHLRKDTISKLTRNTIKLQKEILASREETEQVRTALELAKTDYMLQSDAYASMSVENKALKQNINERCDTENQLWVNIEQRKIQESSYQETIAVLQATVKKKNRQSASVNITFFLLGVVSLFFFGRIAAFLKKSLLLKRSQTNQKKTWDIVRSYFF